MVLQDGDEPAGGRQGAVQGCSDLRLAVGVPVTGLQAAGLEGRAVRGGRQLTVGVLRRDPGLGVELAGSRGAQVPAGGVDHAVRDVDRREHVLLQLQQFLVDLGGLLRAAVNEHLELVELVHADNATGVLAIGTGLATEAGGPAGVALRLVQVDDFIGVVTGQGDLRGTDQVEVVLLQAVDLVRVGAEETGATHDLGAHEHRRDHQLEALLGGLAGGQLHHAKLQQRAVAGEEVEAGTGDLRAALHVDQAEGLAELQVILRLEVEGGGLTDVLEDHEVLLATGGRALNDVGDLHLQVVKRLLRVALGGLQVLHSLGLLLALLAQLGLLLIGGSGHFLAHRLGERLLLCAGLVGRGNRLAALAVGLQQLVNQCWILPTGTLRFTNEVWIFAQELEINHGS